MNKKQILIIILINISIASSFFVKNIGVGYSQLSSDLHSIVPMCMKFDNPELFKNDLFLTDTSNFKYYTPFFINTLRFFAKSTNGNYIQALNIYLFISHLIFGLSWFLLFYKVFKNQFWISLFISILIRGIVWLPGFEFWGISDLWTLMPRTVYSTLLPIPFIILFSNIKYRYFFASFLIGFVFNFHPISGLGGILLFITLIILLKLFYKSATIKKLAVSIAFVFIGMLPFLITYFSTTGTFISYDLNIYKEAFSSRIPLFFQSPRLFIKKWIAFKTLFFIIPLLLFFYISFVFNKKEFKNATILLIITIIVFVVPLLSIPTENWINKVFDTNLRMSFQLIRVQKFAILPAYFAIGYLMLLMVNKFSPIKKMIPAITIFYLVLIVFSKKTFFNNIPFISDDLMRSILPKGGDILSPLGSRKTDFDLMAMYISESTHKDAVFYNSFMLRSAAKRSVRLDNKGSSILIEGNPNALIDWYTLKINYEKTQNNHKIEFLKSLGIDYILSHKKVYNSRFLIKTIGDYRLYKIR